MKLILFGGVKGVGKTTLLSWLKDQFGNQIELLDPGELFRRYHYSEKIKTTDEIEEMIVSKLEEMPTNSVVVAHWHYAVIRPSGYIPQISFERLKQIAENSNVEQVILVIVEAPIDMLHERRLKDQKDKNRPLSKSAIAEEINTEEKFLNEHKDIFFKTLGTHKVVTFRLNNTNLKPAKSNLYRFFEALLGS